MRFATMEHNVSAIFSYKTLTIIKQTILNAITNKGRVNLIRRVKKAMTWTNSSFHEPLIPITNRM